jgi:hypothetical protein
MAHVDMLAMLVRFSRKPERLDLRDDFRSPEPCEVCARPVYKSQTPDGSADDPFADMPRRA